MAGPALRVIDGNGEAISLSELKDQALERLAASEQETADCEKELRRYRRLVATMQADADRARREAPERVMVEDIFAEWQEVAGKGRSKLTADRFDVIRARIKDGYTRAQFSLAIAGGVFDPFITVAKNGRSIRHNDIELICRTGKKFEDAATKAPRRDQRQSIERSTNADD